MQKRVSKNKQFEVDKARSDLTLPFAKDILVEKALPWLTGFSHIRDASAEEDMKRGIDLVAVFERELMKGTNISSYTETIAHRARFFDKLGAPPNTNKITIRVQSYHNKMTEMHKILNGLHADYYLFMYAKEAEPCTKFDWHLMDLRILRKIFQRHPELDSFPKGKETKFMSYDVYDLIALYNDVLVISSTINKI